MESGREQHGLAIAATTQLIHKGNAWTVPSQTTNGRKYTVESAGGGLLKCSCPDFEAHQDRCEHIYAVEFTIQRETKPDGTTTETRTVRVTYGQNWPAYNTAQSNEKARAEELLRALYEGIAQPEQKRGRPRLTLSEAVFSATMKVYSTMSGRRASTDIRLLRIPQARIHGALSQAVERREHVFHGQPQVRRAGPLEETDGLNQRDFV